MRLLAALAGAWGLWDDHAERDLMRVALALLLLFHEANEACEGRLGNDAVKLGAEVADQADIVDDDVVDFPVFLDSAHFVVDGDIFCAVANDFGIHLRASLVVVKMRAEPARSSVRP